MRMTGLLDYIANQNSDSGGIDSYSSGADSFSAPSYNSKFDAQDFDDLFVSAGNTYGVPPELLKAVAWEESRFNPGAIGPQTSSGWNAQGMMQFAPATAKEYGINPLDPVESVFGASKFLADQYKKYGDWGKALSYYNAGGNQKLWDTGGVQKYVGNIMTNAQRAKFSAPPEPMQISAEDVAPVADFGAKALQALVTPSNSIIGAIQRGIGASGMLDPVVTPVIPPQVILGKGYQSASRDTVDGVGNELAQFLKKKDSEDTFRLLDEQKKATSAKTGLILSDLFGDKKRAQQHSDELDRAIATAKQIAVTGPTADQTKEDIQAPVTLLRSPYKGNTSVIDAAKVTPKLWADQAVKALAGAGGSFSQVTEDFVNDKLAGFVGGLVGQNLKSEAKTPNYDVDLALKARADADKRIDETLLRETGGRPAQGSLANTVLSASQSVMDMAPGLIASALTRNPAFAKAGLAFGAIKSGGEAGGEGLENKLNPYSNLARAVAYGVAEGAFENMSMNGFLKAFGPVSKGDFKAAVPEIFKAMGREIGTEEATEISQWLADKAFENRNVPLSELFDRMWETAKVTALSAPFMAGIGSVAGATGGVARGEFKPQHFSKVNRLADDLNQSIQSGEFQLGADQVAKESMSPDSSAARRVDAPVQDAVTQLQNRLQETVNGPAVEVSLPENNQTGSQEGNNQRIGSEGNWLRDADVAGPRNGQYAANVVPSAGTNQAVADAGTESRSVTDSYELTPQQVNSPLPTVNPSDTASYSKRDSRLNAYQQEQVKSPEFKKWFGDSKMVDADGMPLVVYHGTNEDFSVFDIGKAGQTDSGWYGHGFYFTPNTNWTFAEDAADSRGGAANVMPVFISIKNPIYAYARAEQGSNLVALAKERGKDGVIVRYDPGHEKAGQIAEVIALHPEQIKSAIGNSGQFDPKNPDIRYSQAGGKTINPLDSRTYEMLQQGATSRDLLKTLAQDENYKSLAEAILRTGIAPEIKIGNAENVPFANPQEVNASNAGAAYFPQSGRIELFTQDDAARHLLHEFTHAATYDALVNKKGLAQDEMHGLFNQIKKSNAPELLNEYGMSSVHEFVSEAFTNPDFQARLKEITIPRALGGKTNLWTGFVEFVRKALRLPRNQTDALSKFLDIGPRLIEEGADQYQSRMDSGDALASIDESPEAVISRRAARFVDEYVKGGVRVGDEMKLGNTPAVLTALGTEQLPIHMMGGVLEKALGDKHRHFLTPQAVATALSNVGDPLLVFDSTHDARSGQDRSKILVTEAKDRLGNPVIVAMHLTKNNGRFNVNNIASIYSKENAQKIFEDWAKEGLLRYYRNEKSLEQSTTQPLKLLRVVQFAQDSGRTLLSQSDIVKPPGETALASIQSHLTPEQNTALAKIGGKKETLREKAKRLYGKTNKDEIIQGTVDQFHPLKKLDMNAYMQARLSRGTDGAVEAMWLHGPVKLTDGALDVTPEKGGLEKVFHDLQKNGEGEEVKNFLGWIAGNRAERLRTEGREHLFTSDDIKNLKALSDGDMRDGTSRKQAYTKALVAFNRYQKSVLDVAEQAGLISAESRKVWEQEFYVPFYREMEDGKSSPAQVKSGLLRQQAFKKLKGGQENLNDLMENTIGNWSHLLSASMKNLAAERALSAAEKIGVAEQVDSDEKGSVWVMRDGEKVHYQVHDPLVLDALNGLHYSGMNNAAMRLASKFKHMLTTGVTVSPTFRVRNLIRDTVSAMALSDLSYNPINNVMEGFAATKEGNPIAEKLLAGGGQIRFGSFLDGAKAKLDLQKHGAPNGIVVNNLKQAWEAYQELGDRLETVNRGAIYKRAIEQGKSHLEASFEARDLMDFSSQGKWAATRFLSQTVPFFNARIQGMYKLGRSASNDPARFTAVTGAVAMASALLYLLQKDDEDYKKLPDYVRNNYWPVKVGNTFLYIPKPFEIGALGSVVERGTELMAGGNDYQARDFAKSIKEILMDQLSVNPTPQIIKPAAEAWFNYDSFKDRPIDTMSQERLSPGERYTNRTSAAAVKLGQAAGVSPQKIEHLVRGYFGWLGTQALNVSDMMVRPMTDLPTVPGKDKGDLRNWFVVSDFAKDASKVPSKYADRFYRTQEPISQLYADMTQARKTGDIEGARKLASDSKLKQYKIYKDADKALTKINQDIRKINLSRSMPAEEKTRRLDILNDQKNRLFKIVDERVRR